MNERRLWAIVLAGGEGSRLAETTQRMYGSRLPKQFLSFGQARTFLQSTIDRLEGLVPHNRTVVVVAACHESLARDQLEQYPGIEIVAQPHPGDVRVEVCVGLRLAVDRIGEERPGNMKFTRPRRRLEEHRAAAFGTRAAAAAFRRDVPVQQTARIIHRDAGLVHADPGDERGTMGALAP